MDLLRAYSNRSDLAYDLARVLDRLPGGSSDEPPEAVSVRSEAPTLGEVRIRDRLSPEQIAQLVARFEAGTAKLKLAVEYGISESSVKRLLRKASGG